jgi:hypothetical protein
VTAKTDILAALHGDAPQRVPWNIHGSLLRRGEFERLMRNAGLGVAEKSVWAYKSVTPHVSIEEHHAWENAQWVSYITHHTPCGDLHTRKRIGPDGSTWVDEYPVKNPDDIPILQLITENTVYLPNHGAIRQAELDLGGDGIVVARMTRSPLQRLLIEWMGTEGVVLSLADYPDLMEQLLQCMAAADEAAWKMAAGSPAEVVWSAENITGSITSPRLFARYCLPYYDGCADLLHKSGKLYGIHMDGLLAVLKDQIARSHLDFVEAFTPPPMGALSVQDARLAWPGKSLWVNFPGSVLHGTDEEIIEYTLALLEEGMAGGRFLLTFSEDLPHFARSLRLVAQAIAQYEGRHGY